jgi:hypothetical protein
VRRLGNKILFRATQVASHLSSSPFNCVAASSLTMSPLSRLALTAVVSRLLYVLYLYAYDDTH